MAKRRNFGTIRKLPSGRFQASYVGPDDQRHNAPHTFLTKGDAATWLSIVDADIARGVWLSPQATLKEMKSQSSLCRNCRRQLAIGNNSHSSEQLNNIKLLSRYLSQDS
jgi:hypothetical protein